MLCRALHGWSAGLGLQVLGLRVWALTFPFRCRIGHSNPTYFQFVSDVTGQGAMPSYARNIMETKSGGTYEDLKVWRKSMDLVLHVYRCTNAFPKQEIYGLTSQMRRAAVSIPSNIAERKREIFAERTAAVLVSRPGFFIGIANTDCDCTRTQVSG